ncbi:acyltransferase, partial [Actinospica acidiphila]
WTPDEGWQPPLRTPAPVPLPDDVTPDQLRALSRLDEESVARLAELDEAEPHAHGAARLAEIEPGA